MRPALKERQMSAGLCMSAWLGESCSKTGKRGGSKHFIHEAQMSKYALAGIQTSAAPSERATYSYQYPGFRFAPPWAEVYYAFGVFSDPLSE